ncbi:hypothetical protein E3T26_13630 [Cryobacterium sp. TMT1-21]|nr:hypothetical protein E3T26_13630 [Cryobacterium sp. TMT1-21]
MPGTPGAMLVRGGAPGGAWRHGPAPGDAVSGHGCRGARSARRRRLEPAPRATSCATSHEPRATSHEPRATSHEPRATSHRLTSPTATARIRCLGTSGEFATSGRVRLAHVTKSTGSVELERR